MVKNKSQAMLEYILVVGIVIAFSSIMYKVLSMTVINYFLALTSRVITHDGSSAKFIKNYYVKP